MGTAGPRQLISHARASDFVGPARELAVPRTPLLRHDAEALADGRRRESASWPMRLEEQAGSFGDAQMMIDMIMEVLKRVLIFPSWDLAVSQDGRAVSSRHTSS